ncbi:uncharacterized protein LOC132731457 isoform X3 [Ruditapes philippinarum]|uniref:uncharacterized protein LOC132731457 isoform X3 n=1 Tax=Ruditapes philippinarum TaxID=129788 RepID=UPI00295B3952|nr:uncharacterized protein LOC132731457 isoform X3 [Ruditapes philippinarum]
MDFHSAVETFAEAWVAANFHPASDRQVIQTSNQMELEDIQTQLPRNPPLVTKTSSIKHVQTPLSSPPLSSSTSPLSPSSSCTRSLPIHCIVEQTNGSASFDNLSAEKSTHSTVELDSYAILPGTTLLTECVRAALLKLGYNSTEAIGAKGAVQVKNWRPLDFETITDNKNATIDDMLGELTQVATLRIRICSATKITSAEEVKEKLLQLLLNQSQSLLVNAGCPVLDKGTSPTNGHTLATISPEMRRAFDRWYEEQLKSYTDGNSSEPGNVNMTAAAKELLRMQQERIKVTMATSYQETVSSQEKITRSPPMNHMSQISPPVSRPTAASTPTHEAFSHPAYQHYLPGKTRMRTSFDPEHEIPRLQRWFTDNQHPSRDQMLQYLQELNSLDSRKGRRPLDLTNIIYWFKNARAAHRRATKNSGDDSFEIEEEKESSSALSDNYPFLPNRNAVYMVPYPHFPNLDLHSHMGLLSAQNKINGQLDDREPCDLSMNSRSKTPLDENQVKTNKSDMEISKRQSPIEHEKLGSVNVKVEKEEPQVSPSRSDEGFSEMVERSMPKSQTPEIDNIHVPESKSDDKEEVNEHDDMPKDLTVEKSKEVEKICKEIVDQPSDLSKNDMDDISVIKTVEKPDQYSSDDRPKDLSNGKRRYESDDDDIESDYDDDDRSVDGSVSSHDDKMSNLRDSYLTSARGLNFSAVTSSPSGQPLHIPQFPHPLAMHYFPLNTHFYSQQANQMKFHNQHSSQQTSPKSSPGQGQENNNSHRKRRTRVFIDPLSEIPKLEKWFLDDTHPSSYMIDKYCEELNSSEYRQKFPKLEPKNVQLWFKNHRAKVKRMRIGGFGDHQIFS